MNKSVNYGPITYTGFDPKDNETFVVETKGKCTYVNYQMNETTRIICGYVVEQEDGRYRTHQLGNFESNFKDRNVCYFDNQEDGVQFMEEVYLDELQHEQQMKNIKNIDFMER